MKTPDAVSPTETGYAVKCQLHGLVHLTHVEYMRQMMNPNDHWVCPVIAPLVNGRLCGMRARWDGDTYERVFCANDDEENFPNV